MDLAALDRHRAAVRGSDVDLADKPIVPGAPPAGPVGGRLQGDVGEVKPEPLPEPLRISLLPGPGCEEGADALVVAVLGLPGGQLGGGHDPRREAVEALARAVALDVRPDVTAIGGGDQHALP